MLQEKPNELRLLSVWHIQVNKCVVGVAQGALEEITIVGEECGLRQAMEQRNEVFVKRAVSGKVNANLTERNSPLAQLLALLGDDALVQHIHQAGARSGGRQFR